LINDWNERQARRMLSLFSPTIGAAMAAQYLLRSATNGLMHRSK
jgi:hypothetical protein